MVTSLDQIQSALGKVLNQAGLQVYAKPTDVVITPCAIIQLAPKGTADYSQAMAMGGDTYAFHVIVASPDTDTLNAQAILNPFISGQGGKSIREAIYKNPTLGLPDVDAYASGVEAYGALPPIAGKKYIGAVVRVEVTVT